MTTTDRLQALRAQDQVTGIDYVYVHPDQQELYVYFLRSPMTLATSLVGDLNGDQIQIYGPSDEEHLQEIPITFFAWQLIEARHVLKLETEYPGDFTLYKLRINDPRIDPFFNDVTFSFKANCPSDLDCEPTGHECIPDPPVDFPVNYLARDFWSFRQALLDFAAQRYPEWNDRLEADAGVMLAEVMSALGDEMAYYQDRVGREAYLETATQRRSLRQHARLLDYHVHDGLAASTWLDITVIHDPLNVNLEIPAGTDVWATSDNGRQIFFETGRGLNEIANDKKYLVDYQRNEFTPHIWDEDKVCLEVGTTSVYIEGYHAGVLTPFDDLPEDKAPGKWVLLQTMPTDPSVPARAHMVRLIEVTNTTDSVFKEDYGYGLEDKKITKLVWEEDQALPFEMNMTFLKVRANMVPVTAGRQLVRYFIVGEKPESLGLPFEAIQGIERAVEREGHDNTVTYLFGLPGSENDQLVWLGEQIRSAQPDVRLVEMDYDEVAGEWIELKLNVWDYNRSLLGAAAQSEDCNYTLDDGMWKRVVGYQRNGQEIVHKDYASNEGFTIRFGDGEFGMIPAEKTVFKVEYRLGGGKVNNVGLDAINGFDPGFNFIEKVSNPLPVTNGEDPEPATAIRQLAPEAFRAVTYRAVRPEDYAEAAERLPWVQKAGASFRWTGSWLSAFVTPDPVGTNVLSDTHRKELQEQMERFRQAGREVHVTDPVYASIDLIITVCVQTTAYPGEVKEMVLETLFGKQGLNPRPGYFSPDNFTFGTLLERSTLEAAIQAVSGVRAVKKTRIKRRGWFNWRDFNELFYDPGMSTIIQVENNSLHPERGTLKLIMQGGA